MQLVAHLRNKEERQQQHQLRQHHPPPLGSLQGDCRGPGNSSSSSRRQDGAGGADAEVQPHFSSHQHIKTLMRVLLRLMDMLELQVRRGLYEYCAGPQIQVNGLPAFAGAFYDPSG